MPDWTTAEFFAGSGLVTEGLQGFSDIAWANDISRSKAAIYESNHGPDHFHLADICEVSGFVLPSCDLSWASFPCQDLSLAGRMGGIEASRSGMFWEWLRVVDEMAERPKVVCIENVVGLVSTDGGKHYRALHRALEQRGYRVGAMMLDAIQWLPQSRRRIFVVAVQKGVETSGLERSGASWNHSNGVKSAIEGLENFVWWKLPEPQETVQGLDTIIDWEAPGFDSEKTDYILGLIPERHHSLMTELARTTKRAVFPGYRRTRTGKQVLELRFDNVSGCLRTAEGGSSRQLLVLWKDGRWVVRLLTPREAARLMGAPDTYKLSDKYNESYSAMGDAVAVPVVRYLAQHLLNPLVRAPLLTDVTTQQTQEFCLEA